MKRIFTILFLLYFFFINIYSQYKIGFQTGAALNFQTVNSLIRSSLAHQVEYIGTGQNYNMGLCFNSGLIVEKKIFGSIEANFLFEYMLKKVRVNFQSRANKNDRYYLFDLNYNYFRLPVTLKMKKSDFFYYDFGIVNNFLLKYEKEKLYKTLMSQNIKEVHKYSAGLTAGFGFIVFKKIELFFHGETDITPFLTTSDYGGDYYYPFKFHNITMGGRYWFYEKQN